MTDPNPPVLTETQIAEHLVWRLSNSNSEIDLPDGTVLDVAFNAWQHDDDATALELSVSTWDDTTRRSGTQAFRVRVFPADPDVADEPYRPQVDRRRHAALESYLVKAARRVGVEDPAAIDGHGLERVGEALLFALSDREGKRVTGSDVRPDADDELCGF